MTTVFDHEVRLRWAGRAEAYQRGFAKLCGYPAPLLLDAAGVRAGVRVLDAGTGPGTVAALAGTRGAAVVAVDAEPSMLHAARHNAPHARVCHAVLPDVPFADARFDAVVANFVLNHVGDPAAVLGQLLRVCRPGGRVAVTIWPEPSPPLQALWGQAFEAAGGRYPDEAPSVAPDKDFAHTAGGLTALCRDAGLADVRCETVAWTHRTDPEDLWSGPANGIGRLGRLLEGEPPAMVRRIREQYDRLSAPYRTGDGLLALPTAALLASGHAPGPST